jgi:hypothetical protein
MQDAARVYIAYIMRPRLQCHKKPCLAIGGAQDLMGDDKVESSRVWRGIDNP